MCQLLAFDRRTPSFILNWVDIHRFLVLFKEIYWCIEMNWNVNWWAMVLYIFPTYLWHSFIRLIIPIIFKTSISLLCNNCFNHSNSKAIKIPLKYLCCYAIVPSFGDEILKKNGFICCISHHLIPQIVRIYFMCIDSMVPLKCRFKKYLQDLSIELEIYFFNMK